MKNFLRYAALVCVGVALSVSSLNGQKKNKEKEEAPKGYEFTLVTSVPATPVKDQHRSGTCWSFASVSFIESELLRTGKGVYDLSEIFFVRKAYEMKAEKYVRLHGKGNFGPGGLVLDVMKIWKDYGMLPNDVYDGKTTRDSLPVHGEMDGVLKAYVDAVIKNRNRELSTAWKTGFNGILDAYLGTVPETFSFGGETMTPESFGKEFELDPDNYVAIGSYTHHPFYEDFLLEIPDNWIWESIYNVPLDALMQLLDHALENGYSVCWDADVGERSYDWKKGVALMPSTQIEDLDGLERARWDELSESEQQELFYDFSTPRKERSISQEDRQEMFDNYRTTDDHLMHITGIATDQAGNKFYLVKNSWGTGNHIIQGISLRFGGLHAGQDHLFYGS
jgi:bleomycin hydrolase